MSDWKETTLGEILELITDYHSNGSYETLKENVELLDQKDFAIMIRTTNFEQNSFSENLKYISEHSYYFLKKSMVYQGDIIMNKIANAGSVYFMPNLNYPVSLAMNLFLIRINKEKANQRFIFYYLKVNESYIKQFAEGSVTKTITKNAVKNLIIKKPCIETQNEIVKVIESLENKIDNLKRQNETLEQIAQTLFKHWFIDFEFPNADGKPYKSSGGAMSPSELGYIPEGWRVGDLGECTDISIGRTPPRKEVEWFSINSKDIKWISIRDMGDCGVYIVNTSEYLTQEAVDKFNIPVIPDNTVILSFKLTVGRVAITTEEMLSNEAIAHIKLIENYLNTEYIYLFLKQYNFSFLGSTSSIATAVNSKSIKSISILIPSKQVVVDFKKNIASIFKKIKLNEKQLKTLTKTRDALLPKLMSGQLRVKE